MDPEHIDSDDNLELIRIDHKDVDLLTLKVKLEQIDDKLNQLLEKLKTNEPVAELNNSIGMIKKIYNLIKSCV